MIVKNEIKNDDINIVSLVCIKFAEFIKIPTIDNIGKNIIMFIDQIDLKMQKKKINLSYINLSK